MNNPYRFLKSTARVVAVILLAACLLSACMGKANQTQTPEEQTAEELTSVVSATGVIVPERYANLSLNAAGVVAEVMVSAGEFVQAGQPLVRLLGGDPQNPSPELKAAILLRELEVDAAQQALDKIDEQAEARTLQAEQTLNATASQIRDIQYPLAELELPESQQDLDPVDAYDLALEAYQGAEAAFSPYRNEDNDSERRERKDDLDQAKEEYDIAVTRLQLSLALQAAEKSRDQARADWEKYRNGPPADELLQMVKNLNSAKAGLEAVHATLDSLILVAPFSGMVSDVYVRPGEWAVPGAPALTLADLSQLHIETTDLNEIDMIQIAVGDPVQVSFDALPEAPLLGRVAYIASQASPGSGVNYRVIITLDTLPEGLRWGMSAFVDILPQK